MSDRVVAWSHAPVFASAFFYGPLIERGSVIARERESSSSMEYDVLTLPELAACVLSRLQCAICSTYRSQTFNQTSLKN